jgi:hypothetical protein
MENRRFEMDLANQIENRWTKDSILAIKNKEVGFSIKIKTEDKKLLKKKFIINPRDKNEKKQNKKIVMIVYSFLIYKIISFNKDKIRKIYICRDCGPSFLVYKYLSKICKYYKEPPITNCIRLKFRKGGKKSKAHKLANTVLKGRKKEDYCLNKQDIIKLEELVKALR